MHNFFFSVQLRTPALGVLSFLIPLPEVFAQQKPEPGSQPNIILIMADDLGWGDVGFNGNKVIRTPVLDTLASEGVVMNHFYAAAPLSSPTRASVLTGRNPFRTGVFSANEGILRPEEVTLPELLREVGYQTGHFGKWHLGTLTYRETDANRGRLGNETYYNPPALHGYDVAFVTESKVPTYDPMRKPLQCDGRFWDYIPEKDSTLYYGTAYWDMEGRKVTDGLSGDDSRVIMDRVLPFIDQAVNEKKPFLSVVWFHTPHLPCVAGPEYAALYDGFTLEERNYYGCITAMDDQIGRLIRFLKQKKVYENTIIMFCSDNGPELNTPGSAGNFKGKKRSLHEGGLRVPAFMVWKNGVRSGQTLEIPCSTSDYLPSVADLLDIELSDKPEVDGESLWPLIHGQASARQKTLVFCSARQGAVVSGSYKLYYADGHYELYDICKDPYEVTDLSKSLPDVTRMLQTHLSQKLNQFKASFLGDEYGRKSYDKLKQPWWNIMNGD